MPTLTLYSDYILAVRDAIKQKPGEWSFKSDPRYQSVLEHVSFDQGQAMLEWSLHQMPDLDYALLRELAARNDSAGRPVRVYFEGLGNYSPSNWRYLCHAIKLWQHIDSLGLPAVDVVELGGGYGGLALWVRGLAHLFTTRVDAYFMVDLTDVATLQYKVLQTLGINAYPLDGADAQMFRIFEDRVLPLVCMSAYAFSEWDQATRDWYAQKLLKHCRHGLMVWNFPSAEKDGNGVVFGGPPYQFVEWPITCVLDEPGIYGNHEMVTW